MSASVVPKLRAGQAATHVLASIRQFPSLEPVRVQPVSSQLLGLAPRRDILWQAVTYERDAERVGSKTILGRSDMDYSRKKLRPQKGSGRARMGDRGNPIRHDGGLAHNRHAPNDHATGLPAGIYAKAIRTALSLQYKAGRLYIIDGPLDFASPDELAGEHFLRQHNMSGLAVTFVTASFRENLLDATSSSGRVDVVPQELVKVQDILRPQRLIIERASLEYLAARTVTTV